MTESTFAERYRGKWAEIEEQLHSETNKNADTLASQYVELSEDLSYAQTYFPNSRTVHYLNQLAIKAYTTLLEAKRTEKNAFLQFWQIDLPEVFWRNRNYFLYSLLLFCLFAGIGIVSSLYEKEEFTNLILGPFYVQMTIENIENENPFGVYEDKDPIFMFLRIFFNNIRVAFFAFAMGLLSFIGTSIIILENGIMLGTFFTLFHEYNLLAESLLTVYIHGTLEISAIVLGSAAGLRLGSSFMFPKSYSRVASFTTASRDGIKIIISTIPLFFVASVLESFVTGYIGEGWLIKSLIILASLGFVGWYYFILPYQKYGAGKKAI